MWLDFLSWIVPVIIIFYILRNSIDQQKGALVEVAAVTLPILTTAVGYWFLALDFSMYRLGVTLGEIIQIVFLALPFFLLARLIERFRLGEKLQLSDMFRITTIVSLSTFVFSQLQLVPFIARIPVACCAYIVGDMARLAYGQPGSTWKNYLSIFLVVGLLMPAAIINMTLGASLFSPAQRMVTLGYYETGTVALYLVNSLAIMVVAPWLVAWMVESWGWSQWIGFRLVRWRLRNTAPTESIYHRTLVRLWRFRPSVRYLNHGSFGAVPLIIRRHQHLLQRACEEEPMDTLARRTQPSWDDARGKLAQWLGADPNSIAFTENATVGMNEVASTLPLGPGDEVLLNDHEYGAVKRIWKRRCEEQGAIYREVSLRVPFTTQDAVLDTILNGCSDRTRLVVVSHITSPSATIMPVHALCKELRARNIASCIDGPHALLQEPIELDAMDCDFYVASCHKWLCAPVGSGFLYVNPRWHATMRPLRLSWGRLPPDQPKQWSDELTWVGTRDYSPYLTVPAAIDFFERLGRDQLDSRNFELACYARRGLSSIPGMEPITPEDRDWMGWMTAVLLPPGDHSTLQENLWKRYCIEVPIMRLGDRFLVRASCHLYNSTHDYDMLVRAIANELARNSR